ncbi:putative regulator of Ras-like GTPase activity (Roadblock/LC7/MglB family) [Kitasatospora sp. MAP12-15]|uniref:roadblock/LC7 domain-containing protein n=1 Tax=unclassified Kitasatospora TaxID=2633591 RepID=UPI00247375D6|nr:roadblock/LC7 domain-containing protein [Kitasatospora sp. MAP12-44]MDH6111399.1 putative regulator of Ras-like GTPase activity (Roadblock/LC7/MglB family) [Kitasatospora sp. MAP12-44]
MTIPTLPEARPLDAAELTAVIERVPGLRALVHVSRDGLLQAHAGSTAGQDPDGLAAVVCGLHSLGTGGARFLGPQGQWVDYVSVSYTHGGLLVVIAAEDTSLLCGLAGEDAESGAVGEALAELASQLAPASV